MARAAAILTARGGLASHAAVVARGWGIPAVVGATEIEVSDGEVRFPSRSMRAGEVITVDGDSGGVFLGAAATPSEVVPEARTLIDWADELGIHIGSEPDEIAAPGAGASAALAPAAQPDRAVGESGSAPSSDDCIRELGIKGMAPADSLAHAIVSAADVIQPLLDELVQNGFAVASAGAYRLTEAGRTRRSELIAAEQEQVGLEQARAALDGFLGLDQRVKTVVTDWQVRPGDGELNDHSDPDYDFGVLARLSDLHVEAVEWIAQVEDAWPRADRYRLRLTDAIERVRDGDHRYIASGRVDSYHGVWFELHEDLILLAGRTRADEVAAGRA
jgi:pyruvate,orthophosphate dikinase